MIHVTIQQLSSHLDGELSGASADLVKRHLASCTECDSKFAALKEQEELLSKMLMHDPGDAFFDQLAIDLEKLIGMRAATSGPAIVAGARRASRRTVSVHRAEPAPAPVEPARESGAPLPSHDRRLAGLPLAPSVRWIVATALLVLLGGVGIAVSQTDIMIYSWLNSLARRPTTIDAPPAVEVDPPPTHAPPPTSTHATTRAPTHATAPAPAPVADAPGDVPEVAEAPAEEAAEAPAEDDSQLDLSPEPVTMRADEIIAVPLSPQAPTHHRASAASTRRKVSTVDEDSAAADRGPPKAR